MTRAGLIALAAAVVCLAGSWIAWQRHPATGEATTFDGAAVFRAKGCASCHAGPQSQPRFGGAFPDLSNAPEWAASRRPAMSASEYLAESITQPNAFISPAHTGPVGPTDQMPALGLDQREVDALVQYLLSRSTTD